MPLTSDPKVDERLASHQAELKRMAEEMEQISKKSSLAGYLAELDSMLTAKGRTMAALSERGQSVDALKQEQAGLQRERDRANAQLQSQLAGFKDRLWQLRRSSLPAGITGAYAVQEGKAADAAIHIRGDVEKPGSGVTRGAPRFLCNEKPLS